jgi:hypothetical protein
MIYQEQLKTNNWQMLRLEILSRDDYTCQYCGDSGVGLHVHHKKYFKGRLAWEYNESDLISLCSNCHENIHSIKELKKHFYLKSKDVYDNTTKKDWASLARMYNYIYVEGTGFLSEVSDYDIEYQKLVCEQELLETKKTWLNAEPIIVEEL